MSLSISLPGTVHASAVLVGERGVLIRGASGSGKSSLVLAMIDADPERNALIADDRVVLAAAHGRLLAEAAPGLEGLVELRGQGILHMPHVSPAVIDLVVDLAPDADCPRLPDEADARTILAGITLPRLLLPVGADGKSLRIRRMLFALEDENA
jgi:serine kinase of HPr protein (carbohydrate metabolism regulator)